MNSEPVLRQRRHTLHFLDEIRSISQVFIDAEIDMTRILGHRADAVEKGRRYSIVAYVLHIAARVLARHPEANAAIRGRIRPRVARYSSVDGKLTLDKKMDGQRVVLSVVLPGLHLADLDDVQEHIDRYRGADVARMREFDGIRALQRLPWPLGRLAYRFAVRPLRRRPTRMGTFAVTSLGHRPVDGFYSVGGTTITLGLGRVADKPVVRDHAVAIVPVMRMSLAFDHRVIDGAEAADVLSQIKEDLECFDSEPVLSVVRK